MTYNLATSLNNLGILHSDENRQAEARAAYEEAQGIYRKFVAVSVRYQSHLETVDRNLMKLE